MLLSTQQHRVLTYRSIKTIETINYTERIKSNVFCHKFYMFEWKEHARQLMECWSVQGDSVQSSPGGSTRQMRQKKVCLNHGSFLNPFADIQHVMFFRIYRVVHYSYVRCIYPLQQKVPMDHGPMLKPFADIQHFMFFPTISIN